MADVSVLDATTSAVSSGATGSRTIAYTPPAGKHRVLLVAFAADRALLGDTGITLAGMSATYGGVAMALKGITLIWPTGSQNDGVGGVFAIALDDALTGAHDFAVTFDGSGTRTFGYQFIVLDHADPLSAALTTQYASLRSQDVASGALLTTAATPALSGDAVVVVGSWSNDSGVNKTITPAGYTNVAGSPYGTISGDGVTQPRTRVAFGLSTTGAQAITMTANTNPNTYPVFLQSFVIGKYVPSVSYNCTCVDDDTFEPRQTLLELRRRFLIHTGYAAQIANPPASAVTLANELLDSAQRYLYYKYPALRTRRMFRWSLEEGVRFYELNENDEDSCGFSLNPYKAIEWVGVRDLGGTWLPMVEGINPQFYTMIEQPGIPAYYEIRQCIEILPAPSADGYELWIKGNFALAPLVVDADQTTIDSEIVVLLAIANRKATQGSPDAKNYASMVTSRLGDLTAGTHGKKKYIPGTIKLPPAAMPIFLPLNGAPP